MQNFDQSKLKKVETNEKSILNQEKSILEAANYDQSKLNKVEAVEKNVLPTDDGKKDLETNEMRVPRTVPGRLIKPCFGLLLII